ncbi:CAAX geranylgeranyltransferase alpha subunit [Puccinia graminis f. sp. tritici]|uniref:Protein farnesyltransferase/geranylgeranyltransferase type-1 subunit alpha n=1 Tax=Puccinia graminis f. sp. tritici TaxID=56615 RepID=A0A5B0RT93_PUCGR|nr:CAAX geranylgeranyltransferase alpha subunit [Puccinia graminis f. sp. tritici]
MSSTADSTKPQAEATPEKPEQGHAEEEEELSIVDQDELWTDVTPIPQADVERPMVQIAYHPEYRKAMNLFRGILKKNEFSERALKLTTIILQYNAGHYTVWNYRSQILKHLQLSDPEGKHIQKELAMLNKHMADMRKSYQAWQHRALMVELLKDASKEIEFVNQVLKADAKNYHTWTYRQSLLCRYNEPEMWAGELTTTERLLEEDVRNNSVWNHRFFTVFDTFPLHTPGISSSEFAQIVQREIQFTQHQILKAPNNPSAWNYLRGYPQIILFLSLLSSHHLSPIRLIFFFFFTPPPPEKKCENRVLKRGSIPLNTLEDFVLPLTKTRLELETQPSGWPTGLNTQSDLPVPAAVELLANIYAQSQAKTQIALELYELLSEKLDPIRKGYWKFLSQRAVANQATAPSTTV